MEVFLQLLDELDDAVGALVQGAMMLETRLAGFAGWAAGIATFVIVVVGLTLGLAG